MLITIIPCRQDAVIRADNSAGKPGIKHKRTRPYSPWQNGVVERSHRVDNEIFYARRRFSSEEEMYKSFKRYAARTNNICRAILKFKSPNEILREYLTRVA